MKQAHNNNEVVKSYIVIFTCPVIRMIHLKVVTDSSYESFLLAFQRFFGRRGIPEVMMSDNASNFVVANKQQFWQGSQGYDSPT